MGISGGGGGGSGGTPSGSAGGVLGGTYPNPAFAADMATQAELDAEAALARNADNLSSGTVADARVASTIARDSEVATAVGDHEADTTAVHGIADTSTLYRSGGTDVAIIDGGTGASTASAGLAALGGIDKTIADANSVLYAVTDDTPAALAMAASTILARLASGNIVAATPSQLRTLLALVIGTDVQAFDVELAALAGLTSAADSLPYFTGSGTAAITTLSSFIRTLLDDTNQAGAQATLGVYSTAQVDALIAAVPSKAISQYGTAVALPACTYANGSSGVGATLTGNANGVLLVDGQIMAAGYTVLVMNQATQAQNGPYTVTQPGVVAVSPFILTRRPDYDQAAEMGTAATFPVDSEGLTPGSTNDAKMFLSVTTSPFVVGTTAITFAQVGGTYTAGTGLGLSGNQFSVTDAELLALAGLTSAADKLPYFTGSGSASVADLTAAARTVLDDVSVAAMLATLGGAPLASPTFTGITTAPEFSASGLTGATAASRYVGATASGAPVSGTFAVGDFVVDQSGRFWTCTSAGSPGTWVLAATVVEQVNTHGNTGSSYTIPDVTSATIHRLTLNAANVTLAFPTASAGKSFVIEATQDATGSRAITWPGTVKWPLATAPLLATAAAHVDVFTFVCYDDTNWRGALAGANYSS